MTIIQCSFVYSRNICRVSSWNVKRLTRILETFYSTFRNKSSPRLAGVKVGLHDGVFGKLLSPVLGVCESRPSRRHFDDVASVGIAMLAARSDPRRLARRDSCVDEEFPEDDDE